MIELITCKNCSSRFPNNPNKHHYRDKNCPKCHTVYKHSGFKWKPNLIWIRQKIAKIKNRLMNRERGIQERAYKSLRMSFGREPTVFELQREVLRRKIERGLIEKRELPKLKSGQKEG